MIHGQSIAVIIFVLRHHLQSVEDMLYLLSDFGCVTNCAADVDLDDAVTIADLLQLLSAFGEAC